MSNLIARLFNSATVPRDTNTISITSCLSTDFVGIRNSCCVLGVGGLSMPQAMTKAEREEATAKLQAKLDAFRKAVEERKEGLERSPELRLCSVCRQIPAP